MPARMFLALFLCLAGWCLVPCGRAAAAEPGDPLPCGTPKLVMYLQDLGKNTEGRLQASGLAMGNPVFIRIFKEEEILELWMAPEGANKPFKLFAAYPVCAMSGDLGPKLKQGDMQAPEGFYSVGLKSLNPHSQFHLSFNLGYPNAYDRAHGRTGNYLMVHGNCVSAGCFAMTDLYITEIYRIVEAALKGGQPFFRVHIFPFRLTDDNMKRYAKHRWHDFWVMLKAPYDYFEKHKIPPDVVVKNKNYVLSDNNIK